jgi:PST family polysaccharide transporter
VIDRPVSAKAHPNASRPQTVVPAANVHHQILSNWLTLVIRQGVISIVTVVGAFALARMLGPTDFAVYGYVAAAMLIAAAVGDLGLGAGLIKYGVSAERLSGSLGLQLAVWVPLTLLAVAVSLIANPYGLGAWLGAVVVVIFLFVALQTLPTSLLEQRFAFGRIAQVEAGQRVLFIGGACGLAVASRSSWSIAIAAAAAGAAGWLGALVAARWHWWPTLRGARALFYGFSSEWWQGRLASQLNYAVYPLLGGLLFTQQQVGLIVWALAITGVPTLLAPLVGRAAFPSLTRIGVEEQVVAFRRIFRATLLVSLPLVAAIFVTAKPFTLTFFGEAWRDGIPLLRLESVTTLIGTGITPAVPLLYLALRAKTVKLVVMLWALSVWALTPVIAIWASYLAPSIAMIAASSVALAVFARMLYRVTGYHLVRDMRVGLAASAIAVLFGAPFAPLVETRVQTVALGLAVCVVQVVATLLMTRDREGIRSLLTVRREGARPSTPAAEDVD